jgi:superfamily II DNA or RNA helicase
VSLSWTIRQEPRDWQVAALALWKQRYRGVVSVVTGGGKTLFAQMCMIAFKERHPRGQVVILVPTVALLDQWIVSVTEDLGIQEDAIAQFSGASKAQMLGEVNLFVINTARELHRYTRDASETMLIVDECHRAGSEENARALKGSHLATLGLSATPERQYDEGFRTKIEPALGPIIYRYGYRDAFRDGVICPFELVNVRITLQDSEEAQYSRLSKAIRRAASTGEPEEKIAALLRMRAAVSARAAMRVPVAAAIAEQHRHERTLIFHERIDSASTLHSVLAQRGHNVTIYNTSISSVVRRDNLRLYRRGIFDILVSCRALDEGVNIPETSLAIIASSTASLRQRIQRLGRVLRPAPGKKAAKIVTLYATDIEEERLQVESQRLNAITKTTWMKAT